MSVDRVIANLMAGRMTPEQAIATIEHLYHNRDATAAAYAHLHAEERTDNERLRIGLTKVRDELTTALAENASIRAALEAMKR